MRRGSLVRVNKDTEAVGSAVVVEGRIVTSLRGNSSAPLPLRRLRKLETGRVLGTRAASKHRGRIAIVQFSAGVASVLVEDLETLEGQ